MILSHYDNKKDGPPVLFIHGTASAKGLWEDQYELLKKSNHRVVGVDLRGHGESQHSGGPCSIEDHLNDLIETLEYLEINKPITLVGHSYGAVISVKFAEVYAKKVERLLLVSMPVKVPRTICLYYRWFLGSPVKLIKKKLGWLKKYPILEKYKFALSTDLRVIRQIWKESLYWDFLKKKPRVSCPIHFSVGTYDVVAICDLVKKLHGHLPNSKYTEFKWSTHDVIKDQPNQFNSWILSTLGIPTNKLTNDVV